MYIIANWKLYLSHKEAITAAHALANNTADLDNLEVIICPSFVSLSELSGIFKDSITLGAQDCFWENLGHYTGEVSPADLKSIGVEYVILGHSERRQNLVESDIMVNKKIKAAFSAGLSVILCIGETLEERNSGLTETKVKTQLEKNLSGVSIPEGQKLLVTYEPIWAIYPSKLSVDPRDIELYAENIISKLENTFDCNCIEKQIHIIYGGSVDSDNAKNYLKLKSISGVLIGHASTDTEEFSRILKLISSDW